ncbi:MAG TPA: hypothetical protein GXX26_01270 [Clostridiaceae bacterium]|nr:hypothetical protein [Clostridiaceae bacterium]
MKNLIRVIFIFVCIILFFSSCVNEATNKDDLMPESDNKNSNSMDEATLESVRTPEASQNNADDHSYFTYEQAIKDSDFLFDRLKEDYPFEGVLYRKYGLTLDSIKDNFNKSLTDNKNDMDLNKFALLLKDTVQSFQGLAHSGLIDCTRYRDLREFLKSVYDQNDERYAPFIGKNTMKTYLYFSLPDRMQILTTPSSNPRNSSNEISLKILDDNIAYIKIPSMKSGKALENDYAELIKFYEEISDFKNLIIDITGNGGGSDWYWMNNIVRPNISKPVKVINYFFMKQSDINLRFYELNTGRSIYESKADKNVIDTLPMINPDDLEKPGHLFEAYKEIYPLKEGEQLFSGNIYLLVDKHVYSSAESFAMFCHQTGFAYIVGAGTGGDGGGFDPVFIALPESGLIVRCRASSYLLQKKPVLSFQ